MEHCLEKVPENKWEMERSPLPGHNSAAKIVLELLVVGESNYVHLLSYWKILNFSLHLFDSYDFLGIPPKGDIPSKLLR